MDEHTEFENLCSIVLSTQDSREEGIFLCYEIDKFKAIAEAVGASLSIQLDQEQKGLEAFIN